MLSSTFSGSPKDLGKPPSSQGCEPTGTPWGVTNRANERSQRLLVQHSPARWPRGVRLPLIPRCAPSADLGNSEIPCFAKRFPCYTKKNSLFLCMGNCAGKLVISGTTLISDASSRTGFANFPVNFPDIRELSARDRFETDCVAHHAPRRYRRFPG